MAINVDNREQWLRSIPTVFLWQIVTHVVDSLKVSTLVKTCKAQKGWISVFSMIIVQWHQNRSGFSCRIWSICINPKITNSTVIKSNAKELGYVQPKIPMQVSNATSYNNAHSNFYRNHSTWYFVGPNLGSVTDAFKDTREKDI